MNVTCLHCKSLLQYGLLIYLVFYNVGMCCRLFINYTDPKVICMELHVNVKILYTTASFCSSDCFS